MVAPFVSHGAIPMAVKASLILVVSFLMAPMVTVYDPSMVFDYSGIAIAARELSIGLLMGAAMRLAHGASEVAGGVVGLSSGLSFASVYDQQAGSFGDPLSRFFQYVALMVFIGINGHLLMLSALARSFEVIPVALTFDFSGVWMQDLLKLGGAVFAYGLLMVLPMVITLFIVNFALGILGRSAPQMNLFSVGFQITLMVAFVLLIPSVGVFSRLVEGMYEQAFLMLSGWLSAQP